MIVKKQDAIDQTNKVSDELVFVPLKQPVILIKLWLVDYFFQMVYRVSGFGFNIFYLEDETKNNEKAIFLFPAAVCISSGKCKK
jgi:hypothetical protein